MTLEHALRLRAAIVPLLLNADGAFEATARLALTLVEEELLSHGWRNDLKDAPAMEAASEWVLKQIDV